MAGRPGVVDRQVGQLDWNLVSGLERLNCCSAGTTIQSHVFVAGKHDERPDHVATGPRSCKSCEFDHRVTGYPRISGTAVQTAWNTGGSKQCFKMRES